MRKPDFNRLPLNEQVSFLRGLQAGSIHTVVYRKKVNLAKKYEGETIETESTIQVRFNLTYGDQIKLVKELHDAGMGYGELKGFNPEIKDLLYVNVKTGRKAFRAFPINGGKHGKRYFRNGDETTLDELLDAGFPKSSLVGNGGPIPVMALYADGIVSVN